MYACMMLYMYVGLPYVVVELSVSLDVAPRQLCWGYVLIDV